MAASSPAPGHKSRLLLPPADGNRRTPSTPKTTLPRRAATPPLPDKTTSRQKRFAVSQKARREVSARAPNPGAPRLLSSPCSRPRDPQAPPALGQTLERKNLQRVKSGGVFCRAPPARSGHGGPARGGVPQLVQNPGALGCCGSHQDARVGWDRPGGLPALATPLPTSRCHVRLQGPVARALLATTASRVLPPRAPPATAALPSRLLLRRSPQPPPRRPRASVLKKTVNVFYPFRPLF